jgi:hypothetical protein
MNETRTWLTESLPTWSGRSNPMQTLSDDDLYKAYRDKFGDQARGRSFLERMKKEAKVWKTNFDNFSCRLCMDLAQLKTELLQGLFLSYFLLNYIPCCRF